MKEATPAPMAAPPHGEAWKPGHVPAGLVERALRKAPSAWTAEDLAGYAREHGVRMVSLMHVGGDGWPKTLDFVPRGPGHLLDILEGGERADGSSLFKGLGIRSGASDIVLRPQIETAFLDPFAESPTLVLWCGHAGRDGKPLPQSPDTVVHRAYETLRAATGVDLYALGEVEYFLGKRKAENDIYGADDRGYHASSPFVFGEALRRKAVLMLGEIGVPVKYAHSEVGYIEATEEDPWIWEQHEIELALAPLPQAARGVLLAQWVLRNLAHKAGMHTSFAPIVRAGHAGTGLHFHMSAVKDGRHQPVRNSKGELEASAAWLIGGLVSLGGALMAFGNRHKGSFLRLGQAKEAPRNIVWGEFNRKALVRLPILATAADGRAVSPPTVEFRLPDGSAHPYLLLAGIAQAMRMGQGLKDLKALLKRTSAAEGDPEKATPVPMHNPDVATALRASRAAFELDDVFPPALVDAFLQHLES